MLNGDLLAQKSHNAHLSVVTSAHINKPVTQSLSEDSQEKAMKTITFRVFECEGYLVADAIGYPIVTQSKTWNKLMQRIDDVVRLFFELNENDHYDLELNIESKALSSVKKRAKVKGC